MVLFYNINKERVIYIPNIKIIACVDEQNGLGYKDDLLFKIKEDLSRFKKLTTNNICVFGMKTFNSILAMNNNIPLNKRISVILTRNKDYESQHGEFIYHDIESILKHCKTLTDTDKTVYICGGAEIYSQLMPYASEVLLTRIHKEADKVDTYYPMYLQDELKFEIVESETHYSEKYDCEYSFETYTNPNPLV